MIRQCTEADFNAMLAVINDGAWAYRGVIPADRWKEPYMPPAELRREIADGVTFSGCLLGDKLAGVMGVQPVRDVTLIRHAYVRRAYWRRGIGSALLRALLGDRARPYLVGTWAAADWAIAFYRAHGFVLETPEETARLLRRYWSIPARQVETSVVLRLAPKETARR